LYWKYDLIDTNIKEIGTDLVPQERSGHCTTKSVPISLILVSIESYAYTGGTRIAFEAI
jgi:hypothetical protein